MYLAYELSEESREKLLKIFPPKYPQVICHHITILYPAYKTSPIPDMPKSCDVVGYIDDGKGLECLIVSINGSIKRPSDGKIFHITLSLNSLLGYKPVDSNSLIAHSDGYRKVNPIELKVEPKLL